MLMSHLHSIFTAPCWMLLGMAASTGPSTTVCSALVFFPPQFYTPPPILQGAQGEAHDSSSPFVLPTTLRD